MARLEKQGFFVVNLAMIRTKKRGDGAKSLNVAPRRESRLLVAGLPATRRRRTGTQPRSQLRDDRPSSRHGAVFASDPGGRPRQLPAKL